MTDYRPDPMRVIGYNPETGDFVWLSSGPGRKIGLSAGFVNGHGYVSVQYGGKRVPAQRLAWRIMTGKWPEGEIDHVNRVRNDNRFENLRLATRMQNAQNGPKKQTNTSGFKGVSFKTRSRKWEARIMADRKQIHLGSFSTAEEARAAYAEAAKKLHGEFHCLD